MIEWIILGLAGAGIFGSDRKSSTGYRPSPSPAPSWSPFVVPSTLRAETEKEREEEISSWRQLWDESLDRSRWIPSGTLSRIVEAHGLPKSIDISGPITSRSRMPDMRKQVQQEFDDHNAHHLKQQREKLKPFFDTVERNPLTDEQVHACICMDDNVQIVAAAGSGKTSTMVAKTGYALHEGLVRPEQVLLMAFNAEAARELGDRVQDRLSTMDGVERVTARTFHAFGLDIIGKATGQRPSLASWLEHPGQDIAMLMSIVEDLEESDPEFYSEWHLFRTVFGRDMGTGAASQPDAFQDGKSGFRTASGAIVKSGQERLIANWLFFNQVHFEYERPYEHQTASETHRQYKPDFYYPDISAYHEHFAIDVKGSSPFGQKYLDDADWKREEHRRRGTDLIETTSAQIEDASILAHLKDELVSRGVELRFDPKREAPGSKPITSDELVRRMRVFQRHVKGNGLTMAELHASARKLGVGKDLGRYIMFVSLYGKIADAWEERLRDEESIDFEDMLLIATEHVENGTYKSPFLMILSDEFQDSSRARIRLLKALTANPKEQVHLCVVGDDWQGINRFAGADISVMTEFEKVFDHATRLQLTTTFRYPKTICDVSSTFIQENPAQIRKRVSTTSSYEGQSLIAFGFRDTRGVEAHLERQLERMRDRVVHGDLTPDGKGPIRVMLLGRYRSDEPRAFREWKRRFRKHLDLMFRTIHSSKGLEAEYVVLLNVVEGGRGFPSQIEDDPVLQIPMPAPDPYPMAEERRLFYVGLTRARRVVWLYTSLAQPSRFLLEVVRTGAVTIRAVDGNPVEPCPSCGIGVVMLRTSKYGSFESCSRLAACRFKRSMSQDSPRSSASYPNRRADTGLSRTTS